MVVHLALRAVRAWPTVPGPLAGYGETAEEVGWRGRVRAGGASVDASRRRRGALDEYASALATSVYPVTERMGDRMDWIRLLVSRSKTRKKRGREKKLAIKYRNNILASVSSFIVTN